jgi:hypothetical protein
VAVAAIVERRVLGEDQTLLLERVGDLDAGVLERFQNRHVAVAVAVTGVVDERFHEERRELGLVAFATGLGRGDDHPSWRGDARQESAARAAGVDERHVLRGELRQQLVPVGDRRVRAREVEGSLRAVKAAVADQQDHHRVVRLDARRQIVERLLDAGAVGVRAGEIGDVGVRHLVVLLGGVDERGRPFLKERGVLVVSGDAGDHQQVSLLGQRRCSPRHYGKRHDD